MKPLIPEAYYNVLTKDNHIMLGDMVDYPDLAYTPTPKVQYTCAECCSLFTAKPADFLCPSCRS